MTFGGASTSILSGIQRLSRITRAPRIRSTTLHLQVHVAVPGFLALVTFPALLAVLACLCLLTCLAHLAPPALPTLPAFLALLALLALLAHLALAALVT